MKTITEKSWVMIGMGIGSLDGTNAMTRKDSISRFRPGGSLTPSLKKSGYRVVKCKITYEVNEAEWAEFKDLR